jgi:uncharacterized surface protein with fasciclin (FAS1) repeats
MLRRTFLATAVIGAAALGLSACTEATTSTTQMDIVETAVADGSFTTLVAAVQAAGLVETLQGPGPFTVFAPTDEAFAALPEGTVETLLLPENRDQLTAILTYHVIPGAVMSGDIAGQTLSVASVNGAELAIDATDGVRVNNASVIAADVTASNGVIHVIDTVLLP